jgi:mono/diheme cytochrome c family protein
MRVSSRLVFLAALAVAASSALSGAASARVEPGQSSPPPSPRSGAGAGQPPGATMKNPVKPEPASTAAGKTVYDAQCASCHGTTGKGDGKMAAMMNPPKPSDLTDATWKHGGTDGEIFAVIRDGSKGTAMRGYGSRLKPDEMWNVVNYVRTFGPPARGPR